MSVKAYVNMSGFKKEAKEKIESSILRVLSELGKECVDRILSHRSWTNRSGNLTSSIGAVIAKDGVVIETIGFDIVDQGSEGRREGLQLAREIAAQTKEYACVVVAGRYYASFVESKGFDIVSSTDIWVKGQAKKIAERIINSVTYVD